MNDTCKQREINWGMKFCPPVPVRTEMMNRNKIWEKVF
jgi:hypothetical protein